SIAVAASAWARSLAQAATAALLVVAASWAVDASEGFAALAWLGRAAEWSVSTHLAPLERGVLPVGSALWLLVASAGAFAIALVGARFDLAPSRRWAATLLAGACPWVALA